MLLILIFKNFLLLCEFHIMNPTPIHFSFPPYPPSVLVTSPQKKTKDKNKITTKKKKKTLENISPCQLRCVTRYTLVLGYFPGAE